MQMLHGYGSAEDLKVFGYMLFKRLQNKHYITLDFYLHTLGIRPKQRQICPDSITWISAKATVPVRGKNDSAKPAIVCYSMFTDCMCP